MTWRRRELPSRAFADRTEAGRALGAELATMSLEDPIVLGLPRGGVPVAAEIARALQCPLDVLIVRKLGAPGHRELALGAIGEGGVRVLNETLIRRLGVSQLQLEAIERTETIEVDRRSALYRAGRPRVDLTSHTAVVVDDGVATGATATAGCEIARALGATRVVLAVPVAPFAWLPGDAADDFVALLTPRNLRAVGQWYADFTQTSDSEVALLLGSVD
jgi:putative phosphoribosyl transferase